MAAAPAPSGHGSYAGMQHAEPMPPCPGMMCMNHGGQTTFAKGGELLLTAFLSLQPLPADLGNFYAENWRTGVVSTGLKLSLMTAGMVVVMANNNWMHRWNDPGDNDEWSVRDRNLAIGIFGGYALTKPVSTWIAVDTVAQRYEHPTVGLVPDFRRDRLGAQLALFIP